MNNYFLKLFHIKLRNVGIYQGFNFFQIDKTDFATLWFKGNVKLRKIWFNKMKPI